MIKTLHYIDLGRCEMDESVDVLLEDHPNPLMNFEQWLTTKPVIQIRQGHAGPIFQTNDGVIYRPSKCYDYLRSTGVAPWKPDPNWKPKKARK
jgi:hypothetical protein